MDESTKKLEANIEKLWILNEMEATGGEPDVVGYDEERDEYIFCDCSGKALKGVEASAMIRKHWRLEKHKPQNNALGMAQEMGIEILTEEQYRELQKLGNFDTKTSSW